MEFQDINNAKGNYLFMLGSVNSGTSIIQELILYRLYISSKYNYIYKPKSENTKIVFLQHNNMYTRIKNISNKYLPDRNISGRIEEHNLFFDELELTILNTAGEDIYPHRKQLSRDLEAYISNKNIIKKYILVSDSDSDFNQDTQLKYLLEEHILHNENNSKVDILLIISKWDKGKKEYKDIDDYLNKKLSSTMEILYDRDKCNLTTMTFQIEGASFPKFKQVDFKQVDSIIKWLQSSYNPTLIDKINQQIKFFIQVLKNIIYNSKEGYRP